MSERGVVIGIDPGAKGGIAIFDRSGTLLDVQEMPLRADGTASASQLLLLFESYPDIELVAVEKVGSNPAWGRSSIWVFARNLSAVVDALEIGEIRYDDQVLPRAWKDVVLKGTKKDKQAAIAHVHRRYPEFKERVGRHDGKCDAVCIGEYAVRELLAPTKLGGNKACP